jgi:hypothetical protein
LDWSFDIVEKLLVLTADVRVLEFAKRVNAGARAAVLMVWRRRVWMDAARRLLLIADMVLNSVSPRMAIGEVRNEEDV